jgi:DNA polymerase-3 subunit epsilon
LLAQVFIELTGGRQIALGLAVGETTGPDRITVASAKSNIRPARIFTPSAEELARHSAFMAGFEDPVWGASASG